MSDRDAAPAAAADPHARPCGGSAPSPLRRAWYRVLSGLRSRSARAVFSAEYLVDLGSTPVDVRRAERILAFLLRWGLLPTSRLLRPEPASLLDLRLAHSRRYLEALRHPEALHEIIGVEVWPELHQQALLAQRAAVGGTLLATREALAGRSRIINLGGGFHHAGRLAGRGFCIFNDVAVAIGRARHEGFSAPVLVLDLDLHDGNGTRELFAEDRSVFTFSIHNQSWDREPAVASLSIELGAEVEDEPYLETLRAHLPTVLDELQPGLVYYLAGTDPAFDDRLGNWRLTAAGLLERDRYVITEIRRRWGGVPVVVLLAGGYGRETWRYSARFFSWLLTGLTGIEPPSTIQMTVARQRQLARQLRYRGLPSGSGDTDWELSESDLVGGLGLARPPSQFLGHYSHHALELLLEWTGVLERLRQAGFAHPVLELDLENPGGHTARLWADPDRRELLMELRLRVDRRTVADMALLSLEWLLLQNPRATFTSGRQPLPGQRHPGLGLVPDVMLLLILIADQLDLDGITFVPSHYHLALQARRFLRFVDPRDEGWFRGLQRVVDPLSLADATRLVADGRLRDLDRDEAAAWRPMRMVLPISDRLHDVVGGPDYERLAAATARATRLELAAGLDPTPAPPTPAGTG